MDYWPEFALLFTANFINLVSPGAGFTITARNAFLYGRKKGLLTSAGIVLSSIGHKTYAMLGFSWILTTYPSLFNTVKYGGCLFLIYLGIRCFINGRAIRYETPSDAERRLVQRQHKDISAWQAFRMGYITDLLNPMASIAFLSLVSSTVSPQTPKPILMLYVAILIGTSICYYSTVTFMFSNKKLNLWLDKYKAVIEYMNGSVLMWLGLRIIF